MKSMKIIVLTLAALAASCASNSEQSEPQPETAPASNAIAAANAGPLGEMAVPPDNPITPEKVGLGKKLFFDTRLSKDGKMCATCHVPEKGWADGKAFSTKFDGNLNTRHMPTLYNAGYRSIRAHDQVRKFAVGPLRAERQDRRV